MGPPTHAILLLCCFGLGSAPNAQSEPEPHGPERALPADLEALATRVDAAHRPTGATTITQFGAALELHIDAADADQGGQVDLDVRYMSYQRPDSNRNRHLIRYGVQRAGRPIERGRDRFGFWHLVQGEARDLTEADTEDRAACVRDINIARQQLSFLAPGAVLRALEEPGKVADAPFKIGRRAPVTCETVEGTLPSFPLLQLAGADAPVRIKIYINKERGRLQALLVRPILDGKVDDSGAEMIRLSEMFVTDGILVPKRIEHLFQDNSGRLRKQSTVLITMLDLEPELAEQDFDRPK